jgi:hypothetical protein
MPSQGVTLVSFVGLAGDLQAVWNASTTDARLKKRIVRTLIHEVIADVDADASEIELVIHWMGGVHKGGRSADVTMAKADIGFGLLPWGVQQMVAG